MWLSLRGRGNVCLCCMKESKCSINQAYKKESWKHLFFLFILFCEFVLQGFSSQTFVLWKLRRSGGDIRLRPPLVFPAWLKSPVCGVIPAALSLRLFVLGTRSVSPVSLPLSSDRVLMETRIPGGPHIKTGGSVALGFQTNITHFLCCLRDRGHGGLSAEDLAPLLLSPSTSPLPHPTAKSKRQSRRRCCIPPKGQLPVVVATAGSFATEDKIWKLLLPLQSRLGVPPPSHVCFVGGS